MNKCFSDIVEEGIQLVWMQYNQEKIVRGQQLLEQAAQQNDPDAYCFWARTYLGAVCLKEDREKALSLIEKSVNLGSSCGILTAMQFTKLSSKVMKSTTPQQRKAAEEDVQKKADEGHPYCQYIMAMYYFWGGYWLVNNIPEAKEEEEMWKTRGEYALPWIEKALYNGATFCLYNLLSIYECSNQNSEKIEKAVTFAAKCGDPNWQVRLPHILYQHEKYTEALFYYENLITAGYLPACYDAAFQYEKGIGVEPSIEKAIAYYQQGAMAGISTCQTRLGKLLIWGNQVSKDEAQAYHWFCQSAEQGDEIAKMWKAHCLLYGLGVTKDEIEGFSMLIDALNYNYPDSGESQDMQEESNFDWDEDMLQLFWDLGDAYENGLGIFKKHSSAGYYFNMVASNGWEKAIEKMKHYKYSKFFRRWKYVK